MALIIDMLTPEVFTNYIVPYFDSKTIQSFRLISKFGNWIIMNANHSECDRTLDGEWTKIKLDGSVFKLCRQNVKLEVLEANPGIFDRIGGAWSIICKEDRKPDSLLMLAEYAKKNGKLMISMALLPFDLVEGQCLQAEGIGGLGDILKNAIWNKDDRLADAVFAHPKANQIPANTSYGLGSALLSAIKMDNMELVQKILLHPNATNIQTEGPFGFDAVLKKAKEKNDNDLIDILQSFKRNCS